MSSSQVELSLDSQLMEDATLIFSKLGLDLSTSIRIFLTRVVQVRGIPFSMRLLDDMDEVNPAIVAMNKIQTEAVKNGTSEMTLDEINAEIEAVRCERLARK